MFVANGTEMAVLSLLLWIIPFAVVCTVAYFIIKAAVAAGIRTAVQRGDPAAPARPLDGR